MAYNRQPVIYSVNPNKRAIMQEVNISVEANKIFDYLRKNKVYDFMIVDSNKGNIAFEVSVKFWNEKREYLDSKRIFYALTHNGQEFELLEFWTHEPTIKRSANIAGLCNNTFRWAVTYA